MFAGIPTKSSSKQITRQLFTGIVADYLHDLRARMMLTGAWMMVPPPDAALALAQYDTILQIKPNHRAARAGRGASRLRLGLQTRLRAAEIAQVLDEGAPDSHLSFPFGITQRIGILKSVIVKKESRLSDLGLELEFQTQSQQRSKNEWESHHDLLQP